MRNFCTILLVCALFCFVLISQCNSRMVSCISKLFLNFFLFYVPVNSFFFFKKCPIINVWNQKKHTWQPTVSIHSFVCFEQNHRSTIMSGMYWLLFYDLWLFLSFSNELLFPLGVQHHTCFHFLSLSLKINITININHDGFMSFETFLVSFRFLSLSSLWS